MIPWFDRAEAKAVYDYMRSGGFVTEFKKTEELEQMISGLTKSRYVVMTNNGTVALIITLLALDIGPGDEVLVPNLTMIASPNSAVLLGAKPVLVDVNKYNLCMDLDQAKKLLTKRTKALMYVALNGRCGNMNEVVRFCKSNHLKLVEDAAQALGSYYHGRHLGTFGEIGCFSFSIPKIITTGQGGALVTNSSRLFKKIRQLKDFGRERGGIDIHDDWGWNFKFTDLQAVVGIEQMRKLEFRIKRKKEIYKLYSQLLKDVKGLEFIPTNLKDTAPWFIDMYVSNPTGLASYLKENGIGSRLVYPPIHSQRIYRGKSKGRFPVSTNYAHRGLWLPSSAALSNTDIRRVCRVIRNYYKL